MPSETAYRIQFELGLEISPRRNWGLQQELQELGFDSMAIRPYDGLLK
jgi:hypothetical protein